MEEGRADEVADHALVFMIKYAGNCPFFCQSYYFDAKISSAYKKPFALEQLTWLLVLFVTKDPLM